LTENPGKANGGQRKLQGMKMQDMTLADESADDDNAGRDSTNQTARFLSGDTTFLCVLTA